MICKLCNEKCLEEVFNKTGRCSECGELLEETTDRPKRASRYVKSTSVAVEDINKAQKFKEPKTEKSKDNELPKINKKESAENIVNKADASNTEKNFVNAQDKERSADTEQLQNTKKQEDYSPTSVAPETNKNLLNTPSYAYRSVERENMASPTLLNSRGDEMAPVGFGAQESSEGSTAEPMLKKKDVQNHASQDTDEKKVATSSTEEISVRIDMAILDGSEDKKNEEVRRGPFSLKQYMQEQKRVKTEQMHEELETDYSFNFNADGFYDDTEAIEEARPDTISKNVFFKIIGVAVALFLIITFMIYYA